jgi:hypothetical protein
MEKEKQTDTKKRRRTHLSRLGKCILNCQFFTPFHAVRSRVATGPSVPSSWDCVLDQQFRYEFAMIILVEGSRIRQKYVVVMAMTAGWLKFLRLLVGMLFKTK